MKHRPTTELTPQQVLADLFDSDEFHNAFTSYEQAAELAVQRLLDAGFAIRAWEPEQ